MAAITVTAANVGLSGTSHTIDTSYELGATCTHGTCVYIDSSGELQLADNTALASAAAIGVLVTQGDDGDRGVVIRKGRYNCGGTVVVGTSYFVGTSGAIIPESDLGTGDYVTFLGVGYSTAEIDLNPVVTGQTHA